MDETERLIREGAEAEELLEHPAFIRAVEKVKDDCLKVFYTSAPEATADRERAYRMNAAIQEILAEIASAISVGRRSEEALDSSDTLDAFEEELDDEY